MTEAEANVGPSVESRQYVIACPLDQIGAQMRQQLVVTTISACPKIS